MPLFPPLNCNKENIDPIMIIDESAENLHLPMITGRTNDSIQVNIDQGDKTDLFSQAYEMDYEPSELILLNRFSYCGLCQSEKPG